MLMYNLLALRTLAPQRCRFIVRGVPTNVCMFFFCFAFEVAVLLHHKNFLFSDVVILVYYREH